MDDLGVEMLGRSRPGREDGRAPAAQLLDRPQAQLGGNDGDILDRTDRVPVGAAGVDDEVGDEHAVGVEPGADVLGAARDEDPGVDGDRRQSGAAAVEEEQVRAERRGDARALEHVRVERRPGEAAARAPAADRRHSRERRGLEVVGGGVAARARERHELVEAGRRLPDLRLRRPAPSHRDDDHAPVAREQARDVTGDRGLPDPLARADHRQRRQRRGVERRRVEAEVRADVGQPEREHPRGPQHPLARPEHRFVGDVDDDVHLDGVERTHQRHAVVLPADELLAAADEQRAHDLVRQRGERVAYDGRVVLAVDQRQGLHRVVTSSSIRAVYFS